MKAVVLLIWLRLSTHNPKCELTFDHDHVHINGTDGRLGQTLALLQNRGDFTGRDPIVWLGPKCHQLPNCHTCRVGREDRERGFSRSRGAWPGRREAVSRESFPTGTALPEPHPGKAFSAMILKRDKLVKHIEIISGFLFRFWVFLVLLLFFLISATSSSVFNIPQTAQPHRNEMQVTASWLQPSKWFQKWKLYFYFKTISLETSKSSFQKRCVNQLPQCHLLTNHVLLWCSCCDCLVA